MKTCHHCGLTIAFCKTLPDATKSYWAHPVRVVNGKDYPSQDVENGTMRQRCQDGMGWATPKKEQMNMNKRKKTSFTIDEIQAEIRKIKGADNAPFIIRPMRIKNGSGNEQSKRERSWK